MPHRNIRTPINRPQDDPDFLRCMDFIMHVEWERNSKKSFAEKWKISDQQVFRLQLAWANSGLIASCREIIGLALFEDVTTAQRQTIRQTAAIMESWVRLALYADREDVRATAIRDIYTLVIKPSQDDRSSTGNEEADYISLITANERMLDPMSVVGKSRADLEMEESSLTEEASALEEPEDTSTPQTQAE